MKNWKVILGSLLAVLAAIVIGASTFPDAQPRARDPEQIAFAATTFFSVLLLHWLAWRFIVPARSIAPPELTAFFRWRRERTFLSGGIAVGYACIATYATRLAGFPQPSGKEGQVGFLALGLFFIAYGTAARLRELFSALAAPSVDTKQTAVDAAV